MYEVLSKLENTPLIIDLLFIIKFISFILAYNKNLLTGY
jgi:hypothetical protein